MPTARSGGPSYCLERGAGRLDRRLPDLLGRVLDPARRAGSAGRTPGSRGAAIVPSSVTTRAVTPVVPASIARTLMRRSLRRPRSSRAGSRAPRGRSSPRRRASRSSPCRPRRRGRRGRASRARSSSSSRRASSTRHLLLLGGRGEVEVVQVEQPAQLGDRVGVVVDAEVDGDVVAAAVPRARRGPRAARRTGGRGCRRRRRHRRRAPRAAAGPARTRPADAAPRPRASRRPPRVRRGCCPGSRRPDRSGRRPSRGSRCPVWSAALPSTSTMPTWRCVAALVVLEQPVERHLRRSRRRRGRARPSPL